MHEGVRGLGVKEGRVQEVEVKEVRIQGIGVKRGRIRGCRDQGGEIRKRGLRGKRFGQFQVNIFI
jgi:hypothetical protein